MSGKRDSNPRPLAWEANALPTELLPHDIFTNLRLFIAPIIKFSSCNLSKKPFLQTIAIHSSSLFAVHQNE